MMFEDRLLYLSELRKLNENDYHCHKEIGEVVESIRSDLGLNSEINRLAEFISLNYRDEIGKGDPVNGESAVDVAIRLLKK